MNVRNKKLAIYGGRNNWKAQHALHQNSFGFKVEGPNTYIWTNNNATPTGFIAVKDMVDDKRCYKVMAKSYELFKGSWFVTHVNGDVFYLNGCEATVPYFNRHGWDAFYTEGNNVTYKAPKQGDYLTPHLCFGFAVVCKSFLGYLRKEIESDRKEYGDKAAEESQATYELGQIEAFIKKESIAI